MKNLKVFLFFNLVLGVLFITGTKAGDLSQLIKAKSDSLINDLKERIIQQKVFTKNSKIEIKVYPSFEININLSKKEIDSHDLSYMKEPALFMITNESLRYYFVDGISLPRNLEIKNWFKDDSPYKSAISLAENRSSSIFLVYLSLDPVVGYIDKGDIHFIDAELKEFKTLQSLIEYRFGSIGNYKAQEERYNYENRYLEKIKTIDDAIHQYKNYGYNYMKYNVYEPEALANAIIYQVESFVKITDYQKEELKKKLLKGIYENEFGNKDFIKLLNSGELDSYTDSYSSLIKYTLKDVLLFDQYCQYISNEDLYIRADGKALEIINEYLHNEQKIVSDSLIRAKIFKITDKINSNN